MPSLLLLGSSPPKYENPNLGVCMLGRGCLLPPLGLPICQIANEGHTVVSNLTLPGFEQIPTAGRLCKMISCAFTNVSFSFPFPKAYTPGNVSIASLTSWFARNSSRTKEVDKSGRSAGLVVLN